MLKMAALIKLLVKFLFGEGKGCLGKKPKTLKKSSVCYEDIGNTSTKRFFLGLNHLTVDLKI